MSDSPSAPPQVNAEQTPALPQETPVEAAQPPSVTGAVFPPQAGALVSVGEYGVDDGARFGYGGYAPYGAFGRFTTPSPLYPGFPGFSGFQGFQGGYSAPASLYTPRSFPGAFSGASYPIPGGISYGATYAGVPSTGYGLSAAAALDAQDGVLDGRYYGSQIVQSSPYTAGAATFASTNQYRGFYGGYGSSISGYGVIAPGYGAAPSYATVPASAPAYVSNAPTYASPTYNAPAQASGYQGAPQYPAYAPTYAQAPTYAPVSTAGYNAATTYAPPAYGYAPSASRFPKAYPYNSTPYPPRPTVRPGGYPGWNSKYTQQAWARGYRSW